MTSDTPDMIVSGVPYVVTDVEGDEPSTLESFVGQTTMHTQGPTGEHEVSGSGEHEHDGAVRVHEKDHDGTGRDVRTWTVSPDPDHEGFVAVG